MNSAPDAKREDAHRLLDDEPTAGLRRQLSFVGMISAEPDLAERSAEILRRELGQG